MIGSTASQYQRVWYNGRSILIITSRGVQTVRIDPDRTAHIIDQHVHALPQPGPTAACENGWFIASEEDE
jgi:hypothetical protein